jgi:hypothetical protein
VCVCVCVCACVCACVRVCVCVCAFIYPWQRCAHTYIHTHTYMQVFRHLCRFLLPGFIEKAAVRATALSYDKRTWSCLHLSIAQRNIMTAFHKHTFIHTSNHADSQTDSLLRDSHCHKCFATRNTHTHTHTRQNTAGRPRLCPDKPTSDADGREVWMLAHKYEVKGVKEWLVEHGITVDSVCAAASFACKSVPDVCDGVLEACRKHASWSLPKLSEGGLVGVPAQAARELLQAHIENIHLGRVCDVAEGFKYVQRWVRSNEGRGMFTSAEGAAESLVEMLELSRLPHSFLSEHVRESGLVSKDRVWQIYDEGIKAERQARLASKSAGLRLVGKISDYLEDGDAFRSVWSCCTGGTGAHARLAVVDTEQCCVYVFNLEEKKCLWKVGRKGKGLGEFMQPYYAVFDGRGHLWVSDDELKTIQRFDDQGNFVGCLGEKGFDAGELTVPSYMCLSAQGDLLVCDHVQNCVAMLGPDGTCLHMVPAAHYQHNIQFNTPYSACPSADGNILVNDQDCVRQFSSDGLFLREVKPPELGSDERWTPASLTSGSQGEFVTFEDSESRKICMRDAECMLLWSVEEPELNDCGMEMDLKGRLFTWLPEDSDVQIWEVEFHEPS